MDAGWIVLIALMVLAALVALTRLGLQTWIKTLVEKSVATKFEKELEAVRSDLRLKESKIAALQTTALSGRAGRQAILDKRRIEAVENLWREVINLNVLTWPTRMMQILKIEEIDKSAKHDADLRKFMETFGGGDLTEKLQQIGGEEERPFVPPAVWKVFAAYKGLLIYCYMRMRVAAMGAGKNMFKDEEIIKDIKEVMPHFSDYLDKWGVAGAAGLATPLRELVFEGLRAALASNESDAENVAGSKAVMDMIAELDRHMAEKTP